MGSFNFDVADQRVADREVIIDVDLIAIFVVVDDPMDVPLEQSIVLDLKVVYHYLKIVSIQQKLLYLCEIFPIKRVHYSH